MRLPRRLAGHTRKASSLASDGRRRGARLGDPVDWGTTLPFAIAAMAGVGAGMRIADRIEPRSMQRSFAALLVVLALYTGGRAAAGIW